MYQHDQKWEMINIPEVLVAENVEAFYDAIEQEQCIACPTCQTVHNVIYRRSIYPAMVKGLQSHKNGSKSSIGDFTKLKHWGLIREDSHGWFITQNGYDFLNGTFSVPKYVILQNNIILGFQTPFLTIHDILEGK